MTDSDRWTKVQQAAEKRAFLRSVQQQKQDKPQSPPRKTFDPLQRSDKINLYSKKE